VKHRLSLAWSLLAGSMVFFTACSDPQNKNHGPILLGDSSTIVTETDPVYLQDMVQDLRPSIEKEVEEETQPVATTTVTDTAKPAAAKPEEKPAPAQPAGNGLTIGFKEVTIFIPNITTRSYNKQDLQKARGATYELSSGNLAGNQLRITNGTVQKITQRYQTVIALQDGNVKLPLESLPTYSSAWTALKGSNNSFNIADLEANKLNHSDAKPAAIRNAVQQATRKARMSRKEAADWQDAAKNVKTVDKAPCVVLLRNVSWRIEGKDAAGKSFNKEVRIDLPR